MDKEAGPNTVAVTEEDHAWHKELHQAVMRFLYARQAYKRDPGAWAGLDEAEEVLSEASRPPAQRRLLRELIREAGQPPA